MQPPSTTLPRPSPALDDDAAAAPPEPAPDVRPKEIGGRTKGLDPARYGDWEKDGRCIDF
jgi:hypothetical protein